MYLYFFIYFHRFYGYISHMVFCSFCICVFAVFVNIHIRFCGLHVLFSYHLTHLFCLFHKHLTPFMPTCFVAFRSLSSHALFCVHTFLIHVVFPSHLFYFYSHTFYLTQAVLFFSVSHRIGHLIFTHVGWMNRTHMDDLLFSVHEEASHALRNVPKWRIGMWHYFCYQYVFLYWCIMMQFATFLYVEFRQGFFLHKFD